MYAITVGKITTYASTIQKLPVSRPHGTAASIGEETSSRTRLPRKIVHAAAGIAPIRTDSGRDRMEAAAQQIAAPTSAASPHTRPPCPAVWRRTSPKKRAAPASETASPATRTKRTPSPRKSMPAIAVKTGDIVGMIIPASEAGASDRPAEEEGVEPRDADQGDDGKAPPFGPHGDRLRRPAEEDRHHQQGAEAEPEGRPHLRRHLEDEHLRGRERAPPEEHREDEPQVDPPVRVGPAAPAVRFHGQPFPLEGKKTGVPDRDARE